MCDAFSAAREGSLQGTARGAGAGGPADRGRLPRGAVDGVGDTVRALGAYGRGDELRGPGPAGTGDARPRQPDFESPAPGAGPSRGTAFLASASAWPGSAPPGPAATDRRGLRLEEATAVVGRVGSGTR